MSDLTMNFNAETVATVLREINQLVSEQNDLWKNAGIVIAEKSKSANLRYLNVIEQMSASILQSVISLQSHLDSVQMNIQGYGQQIDEHSENLDGISDM